MLLTTRDIGLALRDFMEEKLLHHLDDDTESKETVQVAHVDVSDGHNPVLFLDNGQIFNIRIFAA